MGGDEKYDWSGVDWRASDRTIAKRLGCSISRANQKRHDRKRRAAKAALLPGARMLVCLLIPAKAGREFQALCRECGMSRRKALSRLAEWFVAQPRDVQLKVLQGFEPVTERGHE